MSDDSRSLQRFIAAQEPVYDEVLSELTSGEKRTHWMWFIFPQIAGLGRSDTAGYYAIKDLDEARRYAAHPVLGPRLVECAQILLALDEPDISEIMGFPDDLKLRSFMTLFSLLEGCDPAFGQILAKYYEGKPDDRTLGLLGMQDPTR